MAYHGLRYNKLPCRTCYFGMLSYLHSYGVRVTYAWCSGQRIFNRFDNVCHTFVFEALMRRWSCVSAMALS